MERNIHRKAGCPLPPGTGARLKPAARVPTFTVVMSYIALPSAAQSRGTTPRRVAMRAVRPSLIDLRFTGDPWVEERDDTAAVCLGGYPLTHLDVSPFDLPSLNRWLHHLRYGQARRLQTQRAHQLALEQRWAAAR
jgi:hypothetical protein